MRLIRLIICFSISLSPSFLLAAQVAEKVWSTLSLNAKFGKYSYRIEPQLRLMDRPTLFEQFLTDAGGGYQLSPDWAVWLGTTSVTTRQNFSSNMHEFRIWQQVIYTANANLSIRSRFEQRKFQGSSQWGYRLRERIIVKKKITDNLTILSFNELLINLNQPEWVPTNTLDQNRFLISLNQQVSQKLTLGAGYLYQYIFSTPRRVGHVISLFAQVTLGDS
ncbi:MULTISPECIES: DUF2490 domain-containing protein [unclassified Legionella]|uniref:DUF2490 domain-containing protein n=1 Tax=unclassified Legionella TaxID=2622702 RepID=UPI0010568DE8|nr:MULTISPECIES: DUF2490 domain-containing protein [unclassified Legionella]MDI9818872.1 DUF2490 domain-containing protein [Legionella sp. PL877]